MPVQQCMRGPHLIVVGILDDGEARRQRSSLRNSVVNPVFPAGDAEPVKRTDAARRIANSNPAALNGDVRPASASIGHLEWGFNEIKKPSISAAIQSPPKIQWHSPFAITFNFASPQAIGCRMTVFHFSGAARRMSLR